LGKLDGQVALITGGARGVGRSHALLLAAEGADIVLCDSARPAPTVGYGIASSDNLQQTAQDVRDLGRRCIAVAADVRDRPALRALAQQAVDEFGQLNIVIANAGICSFGPAWELTDDQWDDVLAVNLTGTFNIVRACVPHMITQGTGGSIVLTSSIAGLWASPGVAHYVASKHGVTGLMKSLAIELGEHNIRCNAVHPGTVQTDMVVNEPGLAMVTGRTGATLADAAATMQAYNTLPVPLIQPEDVSRAVLYLVSDDGRYVTGTSMVIDAGATVCPPGQWR
jgi:SDR family mycofactocin-dependent oxidoreductase